MPNFKKSEGYKMKGFSGFGNSPAKDKNLYKKSTGPKATIKPSNEVAGDVKLDPGYEDPAKIQTLQRKGLTPDSQKFHDKAWLKSQNEEEVKREDLDKKGKEILDKKHKSPNKMAAAAGAAAGGAGGAGAAGGMRGMGGMMGGMGKGGGNKKEKKKDAGTDAIDTTLGKSPNKFFFKKARVKVADAFTGGAASASGMKPIA